MSILSPTEYLTTISGLPIPAGFEKALLLERELVVLGKRIEKAYEHGQTKLADHLDAEFVIRRDHLEHVMSELLQEAGADWDESTVDDSSDELMREVAVRYFMYSGIAPPSGGLRWDDDADFAQHIRELLASEGFPTKANDADILTLAEDAARRVLSLRSRQTGVDHVTLAKEKLKRLRKQRRKARGR